MNRDNSYLRTPKVREAARQGLLRHYALHPMTEETKGKIAKYKEVGWNCLVVWDPELSETDALKDKIRAFVGGVMV